MGKVRPPSAVVLFCGIIGAGAEAIERGLVVLRERFGKVLLESPDFPFDFTDYYEAEMGSGLLRRFVAFEGEMDPAALAAIKLETNRIEEQLALKTESGALHRTVNIDPGYVAADKVVLATTKNYAHRIYIGSGIYAEVTLGFGREGVRTFDWTYPDYRTRVCAEFFLAVRRVLLQKARERRAAGRDGLREGCQFETDRAPSGENFLLPRGY